MAVKGVKSFNRRAQKRGFHPQGLLALAVKLRPVKSDVGLLA